MFGIFSCFEQQKNPDMPINTFRSIILGNSLFCCERIDAIICHCVPCEKQLRGAVSARKDLHIAGDGSII